MKGITNKQRVANLEAALRSELFVRFQDRLVATINQIARISETPYTTIRNPFSQKKVRSYEAAGNALYIDVLDIIEYFQTARRGRKPNQ